MRIVKIENVEIRKSKIGKDYFQYRITIPSTYIRHGLLKPGLCTVIIIQPDRPDEKMPEVKIEGEAEGAVVYVSRPELIEGGGSGEVCE